MICVRWPAPGLGIAQERLRRPADRSERLVAIAFARVGVGETMDAIVEWRSLDGASSANAIGLSRGSGGGGGSADDELVELGERLAQVLGPRPVGGVCDPALKSDPEDRHSGLGGEAGHRVADAAAA